MLRTLIYLLLSVFLITFVRAVIGVIGKVVAQLFQPNAPTSTRRPGTTSAGELKQCSTCGVYTSKATALRKNSGGTEHFFCSPACRDKFNA